jgi:hypothetical protein
MSWDLSRGGPAHDEIGLVHPGVSFTSPSSRVPSINISKFLTHKLLTHPILTRKILTPKLFTYTNFSPTRFSPTDFSQTDFNILKISTCSVLITNSLASQSSQNAGILILITRRHHPFYGVSLASKGTLHATYLRVFSSNWPCPQTLKLTMFPIKTFSSSLRLAFII